VISFTVKLNWFSFSKVNKIRNSAEFLYNYPGTGSLFRMKLTTLKTYKLEVFFLFALVILSVFTLSGNGNADNSAASSGGTFWLPSTVMQSVAALYAVFIAIFILSLQSNRDSTNSIANRIKPPLKIVSYTAAGTIYFNGLILIVFSFGSFSEAKMKLLLIFSLISMVLSLLAIVYSSMNLLSNVSGLKTSSEKLSYISDLLRGQEENPVNPLKQSEKDTQFCIKALEDENPEVREIAAEALSQARGPEVEKALLGLLEDKHSRVRITAARNLGRIGTENASVPLIKRLAVDKDPVFRACAIESLGNLKDKQAIEPLIKSLDDKVPEVRISAARSLGILGDEKAEEALIAKLDKSSPELQKQIVLALGSSGSKKPTGLSSKKTAEALIRKLRNKDPELRKCAAESLGKLENPESVTPLLKCLEDANPEVRNAAAYSLGTLRAEKAIDALLEMLAEEDSELRITAVYALGNISSRKAVDALLETLNDSNPWVRRYAAEALVKIGDQKATASLVKNLNDPDPEVRWATAEALRILDKQNSR
jgi:HEAT repeat protein